MLYQAMNRLPFRLQTACLLLLATTLPLSGAQPPRLVTLADIPAASAIAVGDLNGDGLADLALLDAPPTKPSTPSSPFRLHLCFQKNGTFSVPADRVVVLGSTPPSGLVLGDFDGDGRNDLAVGLRQERTLVLFFGAEDFQKEHRSRYGNDTGAGGLSAGRINPAGLADFLTGAAWRQWRGDDRFGEAYFAGPELNDHWHSTLADMDRSGSDDVIFTTFWAGPSQTYGNNRIRICYGPFFKMAVVAPTDAAQIVTLDSPFSGNSRPVLGPVLVGDINGDDQNDLVVAAAGQTLVYFQDSPTGFTENSLPTLTFPGATPLLVKDLNGDNLCDIAFLPTNRSGIGLWHQRVDSPLGAGSFSECPLIPIPKLTGVASSGDIDGDGRREIVAGQIGGGITILFPEQP
jgi:hypothetical protein